MCTDGYNDNIHSFLHPQIDDKNYYYIILLYLCFRGLNNYSYTIIYQICLIIAATDLQNF